MIRHTDDIDNRIDLERAFVTLPMRQMEAIRWLLCGYKQAEIGERMGICQPAVNKLLKCAMETLEGVINIAS